MREVPVRELPSDLSDVIRHLETCYPLEGCGVILRAGAGGPWRVRPLLNAYDRYRARSAYRFEPGEWLRVNLEADARDEQVACVFHSHVDGLAVFSAEDRAQAAPDGQPILPGVSYLVVNIHGGRATEARLFWWSAGDFRDRPVPL